MKSICSQFLFLAMVVISGASSSLMGQDARFSQFFTTPHLVNPAFTSLFQGDYQVALNYRSQWGTVMENPYRTLSAAASMKLYPKFADCDYIGLGVDVLADRAGALNFGTVQGNVSAAYYKSLNGFGTRFLALGFSAGGVQRSIQYNPFTDFLDGGEVLAVDRFGYLDVSTGLVYSHMINRQTYWYAGGAIFHVNGPEQSFLTTDRGLVGGEEPLAMRYVLHAGGSVAMSQRWILRPSAIFQQQGPHREIIAGGFLQFLTHDPSLNKEGGHAVHLGAFYRPGDALLVSGRVVFDHYYLNVS
jgi:type IX secretion system PorP/SprF family membrane protein